MYISFIVNYASIVTQTKLIIFWHYIHVFRKQVSTTYWYIQRKHRFKTFPFKRMHGYMYMLIKIKFQKQFQFFIQVIQKRVDGSTGFYKTWKEYREGFGNAYHNYWIGKTIDSF